MTSAFDLTKSFGDRMDNGRTLMDIYIHGSGEMLELQTELFNEHQGIEPGDDGVVGEAVDVIACMLDLIQQHSPDLTQAQFLTILHKKLVKWEEKYGLPD